MKKLIYTILLLGFTVFLSACGQKTSVEPVLSQTPTLQVSVAVSPTEAIALTSAPLPTEAPTPTVTSTATCTPVPTATPTPKPSVTLVMAGDILLHTRIHEYSKQADGSYNYDTIFANLAEEISAADLALVNQEVIIGGEELGISGYPSFNAPKEAGEALVKAGFDVVLHATNHALDKKGKGVLNTLRFWEEHYPELGVLGIHDSKEDQEELYITEIEGIRIAILNYTYGTRSGRAHV